ncbi:MAG: TetR/AcrR family transcriptional regulator [Chloroflexi bacterium]|nr:TetR/AcrR family transcriptional regulator [Chloroflexota bacterium]
MADKRVFASRRTCEVRILVTTQRTRSQSGSARKARRGPLTRKQILDAALRLFSEKGFARTSVRDIARGAGITDAAIYYHFASKRDLFEALFEERGITPALSQLEQATISQPLLETLTAIALAALGIMQRNKDFMKVLLSEAMSEDPIAMDEYRIVTERWRNAEARILREFVGRGDLPAINVETTARQLVILSVGPYMDELMVGQDQDGDEPSPELAQRVRSAVQHFVEGLQTTPR